MKNPFLTLINRVMAPGQQMRALQFEKFTLGDGDIVFLGDSITEGGLWNEWFPGHRIRNRGIGGDTTSGVLKRIDTAVSPSTAATFILLGTNDLSQSVSADEITANLHQIITAIKAVNPAAPIYLNSVMPRKEKFRDRIRDLNKRLRRLAFNEGAVWIDLWPALADTRGGINPDYSLDELHLNGSGYDAWAAVLRPHLSTLQTTKEDAP